MNLVEGGLIKATARYCEEETQKIMEFRKFLDSGAGGAMRWYADHAYKAQSIRGMPTFNDEGALKALWADCWQRLMNASGILKMMPHKQRSEWHNQIYQLQTPEFTEASAFETFRQLALDSESILADKIDGLFRTLSPEHKTNPKEGFYKRMIYRNIVNTYHHGTEILDDFRESLFVVTGISPRKLYIHEAIKTCERNSGKWVYFDGNLWKMRIYLNGNAHIEVHPMAAWKLNEVLARKYPHAIPSQFRTKPKTVKSWPEPIMDYLDNAVLEELNSRVYKYENQWAITDKQQHEVTKEILELIGGTYEDVDPSKIFRQPMVYKSVKAWVFEYNPDKVISLIRASAHVPNRQSHQHYATPRYMADDGVAIALAARGGNHGSWCEPSAGTGRIASAIRAAGANPLCIEISEMFATILESSGYVTERIDFLKCVGKHDVFVMNPPYNKGKAEAHLDHAYSLLNPGGVILALLPATFANKQLAGGGEFVKFYEKPFPGTSVKVGWYKIVKE